MTPSRAGDAGGASFCALLSSQRLRSEPAASTQTSVTVLHIKALNNNFIKCIQLGTNISSMTLFHYDNI